MGNLADFDLDAATVSASNTSIDADAKAGESLGTSTTDLVSAARNNQAVGNTESNTPKHHPEQHHHQYQQ